MHPARLRHNPVVRECWWGGRNEGRGTERFLTIELEGLSAGEIALVRAQGPLHQVAVSIPGEAWAARMSGLEGALRKLAAGLEASVDAASLAREITQAIDDYGRRSFSLKLRDGDLELGDRPLIMGVLNVTPDSFSDGGRFFDERAAVDHALQMAAEGADMIDVGGESTRPGADAVTLEEELRRVIPVVKEVARRTDAPISIDTYKSQVAREALEAGAQMVNDISALRFDPEMAETVAEYGAPVALMHMKGTPRNMQANPTYQDVVREIIGYLRESLGRAEEAGISLEQTVVDPGIGFGKTVRHNLEILNRLPELASLGRPIMVGTSRKSFIGKVLGLEVGDRLMGTAAAVAAVVLGGAHVVRVHDVSEMKQVAEMAGAVRRPKSVEAGQEEPAGVRKR